MAEFTRRRLADELGCTKQTVMAYERELGLDGHVSRRGQAVVYDEFAASAIAARAAGRFPARDEDGDGAAPSLEGLVGHYAAEVERLTRERTEMVERHAVEIERLGSLLADERELTLAMRGEVSELRAAKEEAEAKAARLTAALSAINSAPFWKRGKIAHLALMPPREGAGE